MGLSEIKLPNDSNAGGYANKKFVQSMYLRNCGFALRAVPNGTVPSNPNEKITMLSNSQKGNGKRVFGNKTATPSAPASAGAQYWRLCNFATAPSKPTSWASHSRKTVIQSMNSRDL